MAVSPLDLRVERACSVENLDQEMVSRKSAEPSPTTVARANRKRLAQEEGVRAMADVEQTAASIRKNMQRLRALREAKEAQEAVVRAALPDVSKKKRRKPLSK